MVKKLWLKKHSRLIVSAAFAVLSVTLLVIVGVSYAQIASLSEYSNDLFAASEDLKMEVDIKESTLASLSAELASVNAEYEVLRSQDQKIINDTLEQDMKQIENTYSSAVETYEKLLDLKEVSKKTEEYEEDYAAVIAMLSQREYASAEAALAELEQDIDARRQEIVSSFQIPESVPVNNSPPDSGYTRQQVQTDAGTFMVSMVAADLNTTRVVVDTASDGDCGNDCLTLPLGTYVSRSGAFAGINGGYFCPATYPSCAGKTNSFDTLLMNKHKTYFNSDNNVYSTNPAVIFSGNSARFVGAARDWGRDTGVDAVLSNYPLIASGGNATFGGDNDPKKSSRSPRGFVGVTGSKVYIGVVHNATVAESSKVVAAMGVRDALNLDGGGSSALWNGGYKVGPGRNIPSALLLVRK